MAKNYPGYVLTATPHLRRRLRRGVKGDILIKDGIIKEIGASLAAPEARTSSMRRLLVMRPHQRPHPWPRRALPRQGDK